MWNGPINAILAIIFIIVLIMIVKSNNKGKPKVKALEAIGKKVADDIRKQNEAG